MTLKEPKFIDTGFYPVYVGDNIYNIFQNFLQLERFKKSRVFILADENTRERCFDTLLSKVPTFKTCEVVTIPSGEQHKNIHTCGDLWNYLTEKKADRHTLLLNLGGGMVSDLGGFAASTFKRGIRYINIPTSLIGQIDASIGGKVGIDHGNLKNLVGMYANPEAVFIDPGFLKSLPVSEMLSGFAEIVKYGLISDASFWYFVSNKSFQEHNDWFQLIVRSVEIKASVVKVDPLERKYRKVLNFGHTIGHALESAVLDSGSPPVSHGMAVATGMICATYLSQMTMSLPGEASARIYRYIGENLGILSELGLHKERILELILHDKKNEGGKVLFTLLSGIGYAVINREIEVGLVRESLDFCQEMSKTYGAKNNK